MHGHTRKLATVGMFLLGMGALLPPSAHACVAPNCLRGTRFALPADGAAVPANLPGLVVVPPLLESVDPTTVRLLLEDGTPVPASVTAGAHQTQVLVPDAPLVPGSSYRLEAKGVCNFGGPQETQATTFTAGPALPLPATTGTLTAETPQRRTFAVYGDSSCGNTQAEGDTTTLRFTPSPELVPFLPWVHWSVEVDGEAWSYAKHGGLTPTGENPDTRLYEYNRGLMFLYTVCGEPNPTMPPTRGLAPGRHQATLKGTLEHAQLTLPPVTVDFELTCAQALPEDPEEEPGEDPEETSHHGCSQAGGGLSALALLATLRPWRRRALRRAKP